MTRLADDLVTLRPFEPGDLDALLAYLNHPELAGRRYIPDDQPGVPLSRSQVGKILEDWADTRRRLHLAVTDTNSGELIGHVSAYWGWDPHCPDMQVVIAPDQQGQGSGSAALRLVLAWLFETLPAHSISVSAADWNQPALDFFAEAGFKLAGRSRREGVWNGRFFDEIVMDILRPEWEERNGA